MNCPSHPEVNRSLREDAPGFTLIEVLVSLFVISTATTIFMSMYFSSIGLAKSSTLYNVASQIAEEYMVELQVNPQQFSWPNFDGAIGELQAIEQRDIDLQLKVSEPTAMPTIPAAHHRESNLYSKFSWRASARLHEEDSNFVEVVVIVSWEHRQKPHIFYLTSTVPRSVGEGIGL
ncbi:prepilin-type N-terminal cleavage/methylation domain-containing protein [bacterium AH-315-P07]|nr:prepilin-type N-terminal cleavage/methylation domain-containing protein [bacterium AH-315-P07]